MASNTDTIPVESDTTPEATRPPGARPPSNARRAALVWAAIIAACVAVTALAVATFTGGDDNVDIRARRLAAQAEQYERKAHLEGQAKTHGDDNVDIGAWRRAAQAEQYERKAHLEGQAKTHGSSRADERAVEDSAGSPGHGASACLWTSEVNTPVFPAEDLGGPPTPQSVLIFEKCNGEWTGNIAWLNPRSRLDVEPAAAASRVAEAERSAKLNDQAKTYRGDDGLPNPFEAGKRAAPAEANSTGDPYDDEFVPRSRHMPMR
jgi:hypothetical protein